MPRCVGIVLVVCCLAADAASAQVSPDAANSAATAESPRLIAADIAAPPLVTPGPLFRAPQPKRPSALVPMYASLSTLQALDFVTTMRALSAGTAYEANPVMRGVVGNRAAFVAV